MKHISFIEDYKFSTVLLGNDLPMPWSEVDWDTEESWPWTSAADDTPEALYSLWQDAVKRARASIAEVLATPSRCVRQ